MAHTVDDYIIELADKYTLNHSNESYENNKEMLTEFYSKLEPRTFDVKLPEGLDEAAAKWCKENGRGFVLRDKSAYYIGETLPAFKAGAKWAFGQGVTFESVVLPYNGAKTIEMFPDDLFDGFEYDDKVIVQIRKE